MLVNSFSWCTCAICGDDYPAERAQLGYRFCLPCGEARAREERASWCVSIPYSKGAYQLITDPADLLGTNPKQPRGTL
jgi:hypothetical protein